MNSCFHEGKCYSCSAFPCVYWELTRLESNRSEGKDSSQISQRQSPQRFDESLGIINQYQSSIYWIYMYINLYIAFALDLVTPMIWPSHLAEHWIFVSAVCRYSMLVGPLLWSKVKYFNKLLDELPWKLLQTFMLHRWCILMSLVNFGLIMDYITRRYAAQNDFFP